MHFALLSAAIVAFTSTVSSQTINPNEVPLALRQNWCTSQIASCPLICTQQTNGDAGTDANTCDATSLAYSCVCANGIAPNISEYSQTIPYYTCTQYNTDCVTNCGNDNTCAAACTADHPCGAQNPTRVNTSTISTMSATGSGASGSATGTAVYTGFGSASTSASGGSSSSSSGSSNSGKSAAARVMVNVGQLYGLGFVAAGVLAGFTLLL